MHKHLEELEDGILKTYSMNARHSFEQLGMGIESKKLPLHSILQSVSYTHLTLPTNEFV